MKGTTGKVGGGKKIKVMKKKLMSANGERSECFLFLGLFVFCLINIIGSGVHISSVTLMACHNPLHMVESQCKTYFINKFITIVW